MLNLLFQNIFLLLVSLVLQEPWLSKEFLAVLQINFSAVLLMKFAYAEWLKRVPYRLQNTAFTEVYTKNNVKVFYVLFVFVNTWVDPEACWLQMEVVYIRNSSLSLHVDRVSPLKFLHFWFWQGCVGVVFFLKNQLSFSNIKQFHSHKLAKNI